MADSTTTLHTIQGSVSELLRKTWWIYLIGGLAAVLFGAVTIYQPGIALFVLGIWFAAFLLIDGVFSVFGAVSRRGHRGWGWFLLYGILGTTVGGFLLLSPPVSMVALIYTVAFFSLSAGLTQILLGIEVRKEIKGEWILYLSGTLSVLLAILIVLRIGVGSLLVVYMIAAWAVLVGTMRIVFAFKVRRLSKALSR